jgi:hypothetical protein
MTQTAIFGPFFATIFLTISVWIYMYASDNLKNLFEVPVIFYALALYLFVTKQVDELYVGAAWIFVVFRVLHSALHCTFNLVILRFYLYLCASLAVWFMAARAAMAYFGL